MKPDPFARVVAAVATPFDSDGRVAMAAQVAHCRWLLKQGCDGLLLFGSTGEAPSLTLAERQTIVARLINEGIAADRLLVGTGCCALDDTVLLTRHALDLGCAGALVVPPFFFKNLDDDGLLAYYKQLVDGISGSNSWLYLYHFPQTSGAPIGGDLVARIIEACPGAVRGYKDSSGDWENSRAIAERFPGLDVYVGTEARMSDLLALGGAGCISATANVQPAAIAAIVAAESSQRSECQTRVSATRNAFAGVPLVSAVKAVLARIHADDGWNRVRAPLTTLHDEQRRSLFDRLGL